MEGGGGGEGREEKGRTGEGREEKGRTGKEESGKGRMKRKEEYVKYFRGNDYLAQLKSLKT